ncbi:MAG: tetratricopeptide repeat protein [Anaerolineales bacterium]
MRSRPLCRYSALLLLWISLFVSCAGSCTDKEATSTYLYQQAESHIAAGEYTAAEALYQSARQAYPNDFLPAYRMAQLYQQWGRPEAGLRALEDAIRNGLPAEKAEAAQSLRLTLLAQAGTWEQVAAEAETMSPDAHTLELLTRAHLQRYECAAARHSAEQWCDRASEEHKKASARISGLLADDPTRICTADADLCALLATCSDDPSACDAEIGRALLRAGDWGLAACVLTRAVAAHPASAEVHAWLGESLNRLGQTTAAREHLERAVELAPDSAQPWLLLGMHDLQQGRLDIAKSELLRAQRLDPGNPAPCLAMAELKAQRGNYDEVNLWVEAALARAPTDADLWKAAARLYLERRLRQPPYPLEAAAGAVTLAPDDAEAHLLLGWARFERTEPSAALDALDVAVELAPDLGHAYYLRGQIQQTLGNPEAAQADFTRAADLGYFP